jgi:hypothetical protein
LIEKPRKTGYYRKKSNPLTKTPLHIAVLALLLGCFAAAAQTTIFDEDFDGGYTGTFGLGTYASGSPTGTNNAVIATGGNPNGAWQESMTATTWTDSYIGLVQLMTVSGNTDPLPSDYVLSFDAFGSQAANIQFYIQTWPDDYYGGTGPVIDAVVNDQLTAANTWQTFSVNLGSVTTNLPIGATWQLGFQINSWQWNGPGYIDRLKIDNIKLVNIGNPIGLLSSFNPSAFGAGMTFTATVLNNGTIAVNATGQVVFSTTNGPFSTNAVVGGSATSSVPGNLPSGGNLITAVYSGGNYPTSANTLIQDVASPPGVIQPNLRIYTDNLVNGFQNWSWASVNLTNTAPVHSGSNSISMTDNGGYQALALIRSQFNSGLYTKLTFWINGGAAGGQRVAVWGSLNNTNQTGYALPPLPTNSWEQVSIPLSALGVSNTPNCTGFVIQGDGNGAAQPTFYVDDMELISAAAPAVVHLGADAGQVLQTVDARQFGLNVGTWESTLGQPQTLPQLQAIHCSALRWPGGSTSDEYDWTTDPVGNANFRYIATNLGAQVFTTVNYGTGTAAEAAAWVLNANKTNDCGFKYWEVGNECYGTWETDSNVVPHDPYTYATNAANYILQMKAAYPSVPIKVGLVVSPGEGSYSNNANHFAVNPRTGATNYGWTPIVLAEMKSLGVIPDFLIYHFYWQYTTWGWTPDAGSVDSDPLLLQVAGTPCPAVWSDWVSAAADLRQQITDYIGPAGTNIELCVTENNSDAGGMGRQSTSLVNALYLADSTGELLQTEFRCYLWFDFVNDTPDTGGSFDPTTYGWRAVGDYGILSEPETYYPTFYAKKLLQYFAGPGDAVVDAGSDSLMLSAYAIHRMDGSLTMLVINKEMTATLSAQIALTNYTPWTTATIRSYGIPQDQAAENNESVALQDIATNSYTAAGTNFTYAFPPLSLTLFTFAPPPSKLSVLQAQPTQMRLQLQGQTGVPYVIESSTNLGSPAWTRVATNTLSGTSAIITIPVSSGTPAQFYRAVWVP